MRLELLGSSVCLNRPDLLYCHRIYSMLQKVDCSIIILFNFKLLSRGPNLLLNNIWFFKSCVRISCSVPFFVLEEYIFISVCAFEFLFQYLISLQNFVKWNGLYNDFWKVSGALYWPLKSFRAFTSKCTFQLLKTHL